MGASVAPSLVFPCEIDLFMANSKIVAAALSWGVLHAEGLVTE